MKHDRNTLVTVGLPSSAVSFGDVLDPTQNGKTPGGVALDATDPATPAQADAAGRVDRRGLVDPRTSPTALLVVAGVAFVLLNAKARRGKRKRG